MCFIAPLEWLSLFWSSVGTQQSTCGCCYGGTAAEQARRRRPTRDVRMETNIGYRAPRIYYPNHDTSSASFKEWATIARRRVIGISMHARRMERFLSFQICTSSTAIGARSGDNSRLRSAPGSKTTAASLTKYHACTLYPGYWASAATRDQILDLVARRIVAPLTHAKAKGLLTRFLYWLGLSTAEPLFDDDEEVINPSLLGTAASHLAVSRPQLDHGAGEAARSPCRACAAPPTAVRGEATHTHPSTVGLLGQARGLRSLYVSVTPPLARPSPCTHRQSRPRSLCAPSWPTYLIPPDARTRRTMLL